MKNFQLASRKPDLINFGILPVGYPLDWIETNLGAAGAPYQVAPSGTKDGVNADFELGAEDFIASVVILNGLTLSETLGDYSISGTTLTMGASFIPQSGDSLMFHGWQS